MKKISFQLIGHCPFILGWDVWQKNLKEIEIDLTIEQTDLFPKYFDKKFDGIRIGKEFRESAYHLIKGPNALMTQLKSVDFVFKKSDAFWPKLILKDGLHSSLRYKNSNLNTREDAIIVGNEYQARIAIAVLVEIGYSSFTLVGDTDQANQAFIQELKKQYFQIEFDGITTDKVILLPGKHSILVNTWDLKNNNEFMTDLLYFNYLKDNGLVVHFYSAIEGDPLIEEAHAIHEKTIELKEIQMFEEISAIKTLCQLSESQIKKIILLSGL